MCIKRLALVFALYLGCPGMTLAAPKNITEGELALTPPYCQDVQGIKWGDQYSNTSPRAAHWVALMGKTFWAMHHYCWALIHIQRSSAAGLSPQIREGMIQEAIGDYYYVIKNATPNFVLLPEIYLRIGEAQVMAKNPVAASDAFAKARELKADYWPAYARGAEVFERLGMKTKAKSLLEDGLERMPNEPALQTAFVRLGGKLSELHPRNAASAVSEPAESPASAAQ